MKTRKTSSKNDKETLLKIISLCQLTEDRGVNPFEVEICEALETIRPYLSRYESLDEFLLDAEAVNNLSRVIKLQGDWVKYRSSDLYADPLLLELKLRNTPGEALASLFLKAWHPIVELDMISPRRLKEAVDYWNTLQPLTEREIGTFTLSGSQEDGVTRKELRAMQLISEQSFRDALLEMWQELKARAMGEGRVEYWKFVWAKTYEETVYRAYLISHLVTYGYAALEVERLEEKTYLSPSEASAESLKRIAPRSHIITLNYEEWRKQEASMK